MPLMNVFDIAATGLAAQSVRLNTTASNLANADTVSDTADGAYKALMPVFQTHYGNAMNLNNNNQYGVGVQIDEITKSNDALRVQYEPGNPKANEEGYVFYSNVNVINEMTNMISASRSYQNNAQVVDSAKTMMMRTLSMGQ
jgi:flagellar basal-body rod protein FlgC